MSMQTEERSLAPHRIRWTRADCEKLEASGALTYRYELIEGDILSTVGQKLPHRTAITFTLEWAIRLFGRLYVQSQAEIDVSPEDNPTSEPEPDVCILNTSLSRLSQNPIPDQVALLIEISDSTLRFDLITKANLYARAQISEYWVLDLNNKKLIVHRYPQSGLYSSVVEYMETDSVASLAVPGSPVLISTLLP
jgi:hypothetical protein